MKTYTCQFLVVIATFIFLGCSKEKEECFDVYTNNGSMTKTVCDLNETLIKNVYGIYYERVGAPRFCWKVNYPTHFVFATDLSEKMVSIFYSDALSYQKVSCDYCQPWEYNLQRIYKPTNQAYNFTSKVQVLCGDTCATLYPGRVVFVRETADSIINHIFWRRIN